MPLRVWGTACWRVICSFKIRLAELYLDTWTEFKLTFIKDVLPAHQKKSKNKMQVTARFKNSVQVPELSEGSV